MNLKVAHLVSIQFGIFIGIVSCLVFFRFEYARPRAAAEMREPGTKRAASVEPVSERGDQPVDILDSGADPESGQPAIEQPGALPNQYSAAAKEQYRALVEKLYYEQIAPRRSASSSPSNNSMAAVAPSYTEVAQEPAVIQIDDPAPQTVAYVQPTPVIVYPQPAQFVVFSQPRRFVNRCRPASRPGALASNPHRRPDSGGTHLSGSPGLRPPRSLGEVHRRNTGVPACPSTQGFKPQGTR